MKRILLLLCFLPLISKAQNRPSKSLADTSISTGDRIRLPGILYNLNACGLAKRGLDSLRPLFSYLQSHPGYEIEIQVHTDYVNPASSQRLTSCRARSVCDTLISWGIAPGRLKAVGYGDTRPPVLEQDLLLPSGKNIAKGTVITQSFRQLFIADKNDYELLCSLCRRTKVKIMKQ